MHDRDDRLDSLRNDAAFDQRPRALVVRQGDAQLKQGRSHAWTTVGWAKSLCVPSPHGQRRGAILATRNGTERAFAHPTPGGAMLLGMRPVASMKPISGCRRDADINAVVTHLHVDGTQAIFRVAAVAARLNVEFPALPRTDDVALLGETKSTGGLIRAELFRAARGHLALADRPPFWGALSPFFHDAVTLVKNAE